MNNSSLDWADMSCDEVPGTIWHHPLRGYIQANHIKDVDGIPFVLIVPLNDEYQLTDKSVMLSVYAPLKLLLNGKFRFVCIGVTD